MAASYIGSTGTTANSADSGDWTLPVGWADGDLAVFWWYAVRSAATFDDPAAVGVTQKVNASGSVATHGTLFVGYRELQTGDTTFGWTGSTGSNVTL